MTEPAFFAIWRRKRSFICHATPKAFHAMKTVRFAKPTVLEQLTRINHHKENRNNKSKSNKRDRQNTHLENFDERKVGTVAQQHAYKLSR
jgi:hypothetical protein